MSQRKINLLMVLFSAVGGGIGFFTGELILHEYREQIPNWLLMGIYFGGYAFWVGLACLIAEMISPRLNGIGWKQRYLGFSWKMLLPSSLVLMFIAGALFQVIYGLNIGRNATSNIVMVLDTSGSMEQTDPDRQIVKAATEVIQKMDDDKRLALILFNDHATVLQPLVQVADQSTKDQIIQKLGTGFVPSGGTNIGEALETAMNHLRETSSVQGNSTVLLMSDGYSSVDLNSTLAPYKTEQIGINTIGMSTVNQDGMNLLTAIAKETNGSYYNAENADQLASAFEKIYDFTQKDRHLVGERNSLESGSMLYAVLRVVLLTAIGVLLGLSLGLIFDNKHLAKSFSVGGIAAGLIAGLILELGLGRSLLPDAFYRLAADIALALVLSLFTAVIPIQERSMTAAQGSFTRGRYASGKTFSQKQVNSNRFDG